MDKKRKKDSSKSNIYKELSPYMNLGLQMTIPIGLGAYGGYLIDKSAGTSPFWTVALSLFGIIVGMYSFFKIVLSDKNGKKTKKK